jgi:anti-sigma factor RsiW
MRCEDAWKDISDLIDENLDALHCRALNQHLAQCSHCTAVFHSLRNLIRLCRDERVFVLPDGFHERLEKRIREITVTGEAPHR